jgi:hypothetical protein
VKTLRILSYNILKGGLGREEALAQRLAGGPGNSR